MVTQCTACLIWFKVTREQLHAAHGLVRCSACNTVFNALATLRHDMPEGAVLGGTTSAVREDSASDSGTLPSPETEEADSAGGDVPVPNGERGVDREQEPAGAAAGDEVGEPENSGPLRMEPYLGMPPDEAAPESGPAFESGAASEPDAAEEPEVPIPVREEFNELDLYMASALGEEELREAEAGGYVETGSPDPDEEPSPAQAQPAPAAGDYPGPGSGEEFPPEGAEAGAPGSETPPPFAVERGKRRPRRLWGLVLGLAAMLLAVQIVYAQRDALGRIFGLPRSAPMLSQYAITGATLDAAQQPGALVLKGALLNRGRRAQPLPLIRVTLTNRYGDTVGARILSPGQYGVGQKPLLQAHQRVMFHVKLADPGSSAVGFSLVLCKHHGHSILCQDS